MLRRSSSIAVGDGQREPDRLERSEARDECAALPEQQVAQALSVTGIRPWELEARGARAGDVMLIVEQWPDAVVVAVSVYAIPATTSLVYHPNLPPRPG